MLNSLTRMDNGVYANQHGNKFYSVWAYKREFRIAHSQANYQVSRALSGITPYQKVPTELETCYKEVCVFPELALAGYFAKYG